MLGIFLFFVFMYFIFNIAIKIYVKYEMKQLELAFFKSALEYHSLKYQMLQMLEIIYEKAAENDPEFLKDYENIKKSINKNFEKTCNEFISNLQKTLGYNTPYNNWNELINHAALLYSAARTQKNGSREGNKKTTE